jgi:glycosyltransferase involved in cell wall biosynthesis
MKKISIITVSFNSEKTILKTILSVKKQSYKNIEHIFIDGLSNDNTVNIIKKNMNKKTSILISEKDYGIYHAMNKGIKLSKGEIIFILNSDDTFYNKSIIDNIINIFKQNNKLDLIYGNLVFTKKNKIIRRWNAGKYTNGSFLKGWSPPHPSFIVKKNVYKKYGLFDLRYKYASDIEIMYRFLEKCKCKYQFFNKVLINMKVGGESNNSLMRIVKQNIEIIKILRKEENFKYIKFIYFKFKHRYKQFI